MPVISVVMPVYNAEKHLAGAIESIIAQTLKDFEFIIINDASTDDSRKIAEAYRKKDPRIVLLHNRVNRGVTKSLNKGLKKARGKYIARMDADEVSLPERFAVQYNFLEKNKDIYLLGAGNIIIVESGRKTATHTPITGVEKIKKMLPHSNCFCHPTIMFRNSGEYAYRDKFYFSQDYDLYLRLLTDAKNMDNLKKPLLYFRITGNSISVACYAKQMLFAEKAQELYRERVTHGYDNYNAFEPETILTIDAHTSTERTVLTSEIKMSMQTNDIERFRMFCKKYFAIYGWINKILIIYIISLSGKGFPVYFSLKRFIRFIRYKTFG